MFSDASESVRGRQIECKENGAILSKQEREDQRKCVCVLASTRVRESEREEEWNGEMPASLHRTGSELQNENIACIKSNMKVCGGFFLLSSETTRKRAPHVCSDTKHHALVHTKDPGYINI